MSQLALWEALLSKSKVGGVTESVLQIENETVVSSN